MAQFIPGMAEPSCGRWRVAVTPHRKGLVAQLIPGMAEPSWGRWGGSDSPLSGEWLSSYLAWRSHRGVDGVAVTLHCRGMAQFIPGMAEPVCCKCGGNDSLL